MTLLGEVGDVAIPCPSAEGGVHTHVNTNIKTNSQGWYSTENHRADLSRCIQRQPVYGNVDRRVYFFQHHCPICHPW